MATAIALLPGFAGSSSLSAPDPSQPGRKVDSVPRALDRVDFTRVSPSPEAGKSFVLHRFCRFLEKRYPGVNVEFRRWLATKIAIPMGLGTDSKGPEGLKRNVLASMETRSGRWTRPLGMPAPPVRGPPVV